MSIKKNFRYYSDYFLKAPSHGIQEKLLCLFSDLSRPKAIPIKCFVSHRPPSREGGSVGRAKKKKMNT